MRGIIGPDRTVMALVALCAGLGASAWLAPQWLVFLLALAIAKGLVVLGLLLLMRTGLVSFGQGLYFGLGAYAAALLAHRAGIGDAAVMLLAGTACAALVAAVLGLLLARYREIFFAMLSLAFSMILYGLLVKSSTLGSTDGFNLHAKSFAGIALGAADARRVFYGVSAIAVLGVGWALHRYLGSHWGRLSSAIRDNELRVEYLGASVYRVVYVNYVIAAALAGLGGAFAALAVGHVDPETVYWTTSGEFVFIAILAGTGNVLAPFLSAAIFEALRILASQYAPNVWQMALGAAMLAIIMFLPGGLWTLLKRKPA
ncbi:MAG TPA: branched-chain amino acid ABC transporter permease [Burkholderiales bacterium]|nr:branched-chain amino acid ABC transporter permease [Burkholderiales bacterium]